MHITKGTWCMCEQCVPGSLPSFPTHRTLGTRLCVPMEAPQSANLGSTLNLWVWSANYMARMATQRQQEWLLWSVPLPSIAAHSVILMSCEHNNIQCTKTAELVGA